MTHDPAVSDADLACLVEENREAIAQLRHFLAELSPAAYRQPFGTDGRHSLGKHVRHILDHYDALLAAAEAGRIDYEHRRRDARLEHWPREAERHLRDIERGLDRLVVSPGRQALALDYPLDQETSLTLGSSLARELAFLTSHTIHHMALLGVLAEQLGVTLPETFGVHPSTLRFWQREREREEQWTGRATA